MSVGKRIYLKRPIPDKALMDEFAKLPASNPVKLALKDIMKSIGL